MTLKNFCLFVYSLVSNYSIEYSLNSSDIKNEYDVVIIGAGIAGLAAAKTLLENNIENFTILEAQDYVGGRIKSKAYNGGFIEYGAQWIHGDGNQLKEFAEEFKLTSNTTSTEGEGFYLRNDGFEYDPKLWCDVDKVVYSILNKCKDFCKDNTKHEISIGEYLSTEFDKHVKTLTISEEEKKLWFEIFEWHLRFQEIDNSCSSLCDLSVDAWGLYGEDEQTHLNLSNGYCSIIETILKIISPQKVQLNKPVKKIIWDSKNIVNFNPIIICNNDDIIKAKHVICTISLGCLKAQLNKMFEPCLPQKFVNCINCLGYDSIGKIFIQFEENWWGDAKGFQVTWTNNENSFAGQDCWLRCLSGFDLLTTGPPNTLLGWVNHKGVKIIEKLPIETIKNDCYLFFKLITKRQSLPKIKMVERSLWDSNEYIKGSYCYITRACDEYKVGPHTLCKPINNNLREPAILFAGEACHSSFFSTTHGAFDSGYQQALHLTNFLKIKNKTPK